MCVGKVLRPLSCCVFFGGLVFKLYVLCCTVFQCISCFFSQMHLITRQKWRCIVRHESQRPLPASRWDSPVVDEQKDVKDENIDTQVCQ